MELCQFERLNGGLLVRAPAKINLSLLIAGKRRDGYHEIDTLMAKVDWYDELFFERTKHRGLELVCRGRHWAPDGPDNHAYTAIRMLMESTGYQEGLRVTLNKDIPAGTGLGSASSDAAAALLGFNEFANLGFSRDQLAVFAARIGSDVPFFLYGPLSRCRGRGEIVEPVGLQYNFSAILILPSLVISTKKVYELYRHDSGLYGQAAAHIGSELAAGSVDSVARMCVNMLEDACFSFCQELREVKAVLSQLGIGRVCLSGSGSAMYVICDNPIVNINHIQDIIREKVGCDSVIVNSNRW